MTRRAQIRKAVFPAAGLGTRFLPATKAQPKEMLPLVDTPAIQYVIEEAVASGIESIIIVTGRGKSSIEDHFDIAVELEQVLRKKGKTAELRQVRAISIRARQPGWAIAEPPASSSTGESCAAPSPSMLSRPSSTRSWRRNQAS